MVAARLFHLSDLHLAFRPRQVDPLTLLGTRPANLPEGWSLAWQSSYHPGALLSAVQLLDNAAPPDAVLVTGDVATSGEPDDLRIGATVLRAPPTHGFLTPHPLAGTEVPASSVLPTLQHLPGVAWIPGNHDRYQTAPTPWEPGGQAFDTVVGWRPCAGQERPRVTGPHLFGAHGQLRVLGLDATLNTRAEQANPPAGFLAEGLVRDRDLELLQQATPPPSPQHFTVWMVHWPPEFPANLARPLHGLQHEDRLLAAARASGVDLILSGHTHRDVVYQTSVGVPVACCGTTTQSVNSQPHTLLELALQRAGPMFSADVRRWRFDVPTVQFVRHGGWRISGGSVAQLPP